MCTQPTVRKESTTGDGIRISYTPTGEFSPYSKVHIAYEALKGAIDEDFDQIFSRAREIMFAKRDIYTAGRDPLENFKQAAIIMRCTPERALEGMMIKHLVYLLDVIREIEDTKQTQQTMEQIDEKIVDVINYLILLRKMIRQRRS